MHAAVVSPVVLPYDPGGHAVQKPDPLRLYVPSGHSIAVAFVDPATHAYPALQLPLHDAFARPLAAPYRPALQPVHAPAPAKLYVPGPHRVAVPFVDPAGHAYPALQLPLHAAVGRPAAAPKVPAGHAPLHNALPMVLVAPNLPAGHAVHAPAPLRL